MKILVIGAGAVSGYFGARLQQNGRDVTFLVRDKRAAQLRRDGLRITGALGEFSVEPKLLSAEELAESRKSFDLIILGVKAYSLAQAMDDFGPAVGVRTTILPLLNGMAHLDVLRARFGVQAVLGGLTRIVADLDANGNVVLVEKLHDMTFGALDGEMTPLLDEVNRTLSNSGFDAILSPNIRAAMWVKWVLLSSYGAITLLGRGTIGEVNRAHGGHALALAILREASMIAAANGFPIPPETAAYLEKRVTPIDSVLVSSMYRDLHKAAPVEADHIFGDLLRYGAEHGLESPLLSAAYTQTKVYEARRS